MNSITSSSVSKIFNRGELVITECWFINSSKSHDVLGSAPHFFNGLFSQQPSFNGSLLSVQEMNGGVLKRGHVELLVKSGDDETSLFTLGLFAEGLSSFMSSSEEANSDEDATPTAGMELAVQGVQMRPLTFLKGQGDLMGHFWSGTASEPTTAYKRVTLKQNHKQVIALNNGALLDFTALGAVSIDLNGKIEISLRYKNANSEVVQK